MTVYEKMRSGEIYFCDDPDLLALQMKCLDRLYDFNNSRPTEFEKRAALLKEMFCEIGAGSIVTRDIPANVVAVGNPCRVMREIGEHDRKYYFRDREIDPAIFEEV